MAERFHPDRVNRLIVQLIKQMEKEVEDDPLYQMDMQLCYYLKMSQAEIEALTVEEWARAWCHLKHIREQEAKETPK